MYVVFDNGNGVFNSFINTDTLITAIDEVQEIERWIKDKNKFKSVTMLNYTLLREIDSAKLLE